MQWLIDNREWLFGGIAVAVPLAIIGWVVGVRRSKQIQKSGSHSTNIQVGGNMRIGSGRKDDE